MNRIVTRGFGPSHQIVTRGYGAAVAVIARELIELKSYINMTLERVSNVKSGYVW